MFSRNAIVAALASLATLSAVSACQSDVDCPGNLDCIRVGFSKKCVPVSCATGAAYAVLETGWDAEEYMREIRSSAGLRGTIETVAQFESARPSISEAMKLKPPPTELFTQNYTACLNPEGSEQTRGSRTWTGFQFSMAALFSYFYKEFTTEVLGFEAKTTSNCVGFMLGGDFGVDFLWHITNGDFVVRRRLEDGEGDDDPTEQFGGDDETQFLPILTAGPFGLQYGWIPGTSTDDYNILEITLGGSLGAQLLGWNSCGNDYS